VKIKFRLIIGIIVIITLFFVFASINKEKLIGGQRDEHGCLGPAGYSWNESINACVREWELNSSDARKAAQLAAENLTAKGLTVLDVEAKNCTGCFNVAFDSLGPGYFTEIENWTVLGTTIIDFI